MAKLSDLLGKEDSASGVDSVGLPRSTARAKIGRYQVLFPVGQGGMSDVYAGQLSGLAGFQKLVAIKVIHPHLSRETSFVKMFLDEARLAGMIHHPNVAEIHEVGEDKGLLYMVGELVLGQNLKEIGNRAARLGRDVSHAVWAKIGAKIAHSLHAAHQLTDAHDNPLQLVHRDVAPRNILVSYDGFIKLIDFGLAWAKERLSKTEVGTVKGTIGYMSPEQFSGKQVDARADIFSLGVVLYRLVTGAHPFEGDDDIQRIQNVIKGTAVPAREVNADVAPELEALLAKAMARSPDDRFATAAVLAGELERFVGQSGVQTSTDVLAKMMQELFADEYRLMQKKRRGKSTDEKLIFQPDESPVSYGLSSSTSFSLADLAGKLVGKRAKKRRDAGDPHAWKTRQLSLIAIGVGVACLVLSAVLIGAMFLRNQPPDAGGSAPPGQAVSAGEPTLPAASAVVPATVAPKPASNEEGNDLAGMEFVEVRLRLQPESAAVSMDNEFVGNGLDRLVLPKDGRVHLIEVSAPGFRTHMEPIMPNTDQVLIIQLEQEGQATPGKKGSKKSKKKAPGKALPAPDEAQVEPPGESGKDEMNLLGNPFG